MKTELILFKFYEAEKGEFLFQVVNKKIPYIVWGNRYGRIGRFLIYEEELEENEYNEITKEEFLRRMKMYADDIQNTISKIEETSEEEYQEKMQMWKENYKDSIAPFEGTRILLNPDNINEKLIESLCQEGSEIDEETIKNIFDDFRKSDEKRIEKTITLTNGRVFNLLYRQ